MKAFDDAVDRLLFGFARRASDRVVAVTAAILYAGLGLALPLWLSVSTAWFVFANLISTLLAGTVLLAWFAVQVQAANRRHLMEWTTNLRLLDYQEFEWLVGEVFHREGWKVEETGQRGYPDGNIDLRLTKDRKRVLVQCKAWKSKDVGVDEIRAFAGTLMREGLPAANGYFVTLSQFTPQARVEATQLGLVLLDNRELLSRIESLRRREACPICGSTMLLDRSGRGWWFRCIAPGCSGKRDLGNDPARAVELLTEPPG